MSRPAYLPEPGTWVRGRRIGDETGAGWPTTRRYARSLSDAFAAERAPAIERPAPRLSLATKLAGAVLASGIGAAISLVLLFGPGGLAR